ncbi:MAG: hypothetical protein LBQ15_07625 [Clostridium sp.]|jgi:hypothetical protein|nr:hypothetical protein [Clostridium sp.]
MMSDEQFEDSFQSQLHEQIRGIAKQFLNEYQIERLDHEEIDPKLSETLYTLIKNEADRQGLYTTPPPTWNSLGVPEYIGYDHVRKIPIWSYKDRAGVEQSEHAIPLHASL